MLARCAKFKIASDQEIDTPLLLPSFSSKGFPDLKRIIRSLEEHIIGPVLISAYDFHHNFISLQSLKFSRELIVVDSGGYECSTVVDFSAHEKETYKPGKWNKELYKASVKTLIKDDIPKVIISYDHPKVRKPIDEQIKSAQTIFDRLESTNFVKEILLKPETRDREKQYLSLEKIIAATEKLDSFHIIGVTEKELGRSLADRMRNLAYLRQSLKARGMEKPIHVFGSLDTITTPLYFMCGADIFDGLTWLRYSYYNGFTLYQPNYWLLKYSPDRNDLISKLHCFIDNHNYLRQMLVDMKSFQKTGDFGQFSSNGEVLKRIWGSLQGEILGGN